MSATWVDETTLPTAIRLGLTTPEKRTNSAPWLMPICFSPLTNRFPLGSTSITVTLMVPVKALLLALSPLPLKLLADLVPRFMPSRPLPGKPTSALTEVLLPLVRAAVLPDFLLAAVVSLMLIVNISPTALARRSSNKARGG